MTDDRSVQRNLDLLRDERARELFALRRLERIYEAEERLLDRRLRELGEQHDRAARRLVTEYRPAHLGSSPPQDRRER